MSHRTENRPDRPAPVAILYFSGVGGTRLAAELLGRLLPGTAGEVRSIEDPEAPALAARAGFLVLCYPTFFLKPAPAMQDFIRNLPAETGGRSVALLTTYELYTGNSNRFAARLLKARGFRVVGSEALRAPGTDVTGVVPDWLCPWLYRFERRFPEKLAGIAQRIAALAGSPPSAERIPPPKWYTPLAWPFQVIFLDGFIRWRDRMKVLGERCSGCDRCVRECPHGAWRRTESGLEHRGERCDLCMRCFHRCPGRAIVLIKGLKDNRRLDAALYWALQREAQEMYATSAETVHAQRE